MPVKTFECPMCGFEVKAETEGEALKYAMMHAQDKHPEKSMTEEEFKKMIK